MNVGILGGGQLGRMLALAGYPLGIRFRTFEPSPDAPAGDLTPVTRAPYDDRDALRRFADGLDVVTYETESIPLGATHFLLDHVPVLPGPLSLSETQERVREKALFGRLGIPTARWRSATTSDELADSIALIGVPAVVKRCTDGYDGKGQMIAHAPADGRRIWRALGGVPVIVEATVPFDRELSIIAVRDRQRQISFYPLVENEHRDGMLTVSRAPARGVLGRTEVQARAYVTWILEALDHVGTLTLEMFEVAGTLIANEIAPRVHNSGHWTIEGALTSQFENHLRAICGLPLGPTDAIGHAGMINLVGTMPPPDAWPNLRVHRYGKSARPGRKLGHVTVVADSPAEVERAISVVRATSAQPTPIRERAPLRAVT